MYLHRSEAQRAEHPWIQEGDRWLQSHLAVQGQGQAQPQLHLVPQRQGAEERQGREHQKQQVSDK